MCLVRSYEHLKTKYLKALADIRFVRSCKTENITANFAKVKLPLKHSINKSNLHIARLVTETEMQNKTP